MPCSGSMDSECSCCYLISQRHAILNGLGKDEGSEAKGQQKDGENLEQLWQELML